MMHGTYGKIIIYHYLLLGYLPQTGTWITKTNRNNNNSTLIFELDFGGYEMINFEN